ncbi:hypothetical protein TraAM80_07443 [Trypanosoma rangeli]|uniref:EF-hand domain-containing protein n=1 Tax=Trypanosoma rangeli TaxID=5698 RepID=A0A422N5G9_TRYRA|nr:uncharacterized protein TraAM80_07443 [Trypanosoma rangeli]RNF00718.1 hypothetical protein TraAM80_07443 [Trypanosoma rangeli]|eukprot:RNF00718.1 hypothetical protein TraAM80_07443 [Trypanosoma rangeli]
MEDDLFILTDRSGDGAVTVDETTHYFERHGFLPEKDAPLVPFKDALIDATMFRPMVDLLCAHCRAALGGARDVCVWSRRFTPLSASASPRLKCPPPPPCRVMEDIEERLMRHGE